tara:strand:+ start:93 stop:239 length:147 start_codon:yes stop_codon:yes gene_type:complete
MTDILNIDTGNGFTTGFQTQAEIPPSVMKVIWKLRTRYLRLKRRKAKK